MKHPIKPHQTDGLSDAELDTVSGGWISLFLSGPPRKEAREDRKVENVRI